MNLRPEGEVQEDLALNREHIKKGFPILKEALERELMRSVFSRDDEHLGECIRKYKYLSEIETYVNNLGEENNV